MKGKLDALYDQYIAGNRPFSFGGRSAVLRAHPQLPREKVLDKLYSVHSYTSHREAKRPKVYNPVYVRAPRKLLQADLLEPGKETWRKNRGVRYLLMIQDTFSRKLFVRTLKSKSEAYVTPAFREVLNEMKPLHPKCLLLADKGKEFDNREFRNMLEREGVELIQPGTSHHAPHIERANLSLQRILHRHLEERGTGEYLSKLPDLVDVFNSRYHRIIGMSPEQAESPAARNEVVANLQKYYDKAEQKAAKKKGKNKLAIGDHVKLLKERTSFTRGYQRRFTNQVFKVVGVDDNLPVALYEIEALDGDPVTGKFYPNELQKKTGSSFKVERVLGTRTVNRRKQWLVKWLGYPDSFNSWIDNEPT